MKHVLLYCVYIFFSASYGHPAETFEVPIYFPQKRPHNADAYLCTSISLETFTPSNNLYIEAFRPVADMSAVHHMLLYGCFEPGITSKPMWNCGTMLGGDEKGSQDDLPIAGICSKGVPRILYAWARNAPQLVLPKDVAFQVGGNTGINSLVLQFHTGSGANHHQEDIVSDQLIDVGLVLRVSKMPSRKLAGIYLLAAAHGIIPPRKTVNFEMACFVRKNVELHPFAFRTHSHSLGKVISGYRVRPTASQSKSHFEWTLIGKKDPQLPQMFYPVENDTLVVRRGDILAARCTMTSDRPTITRIGPTATDEMCNFYMMYYVEDGLPLEDDTCWSDDFWRKSPLLSLSNFPEDASIL